MSNVESQSEQSPEGTESDEALAESGDVVEDVVEDEDVVGDGDVVEEAEAEEAPDDAEPEAAVPVDPLATKPGMGWYVLRVASNKEEQVRDALDRKVKIEGLEDRIGRILVPMVKEKTIRRGQARIVQRKLYAGYVFVEMATEPDGSIPENVWFLVKETTGVGDFIQSDGRPTSMKSIEVDRMLAAVTQTEEEASLSGVKFKPGDRVKIREGPFENFEGDVEAIDEQKGMVTVLLTIFGRQSPVDVEYWNVESL
ncbi:MAG: transcription termination/antitermination factor NusG [Phycisphaerae bacterium]|nr:transcription termination/antitermination factor NusG [Phycisphaerae bacterium]